MTGHAIWLATTWKGTAVQNISVIKEQRKRHYSPNTQHDSEQTADNDWKEHNAFLDEKSHQGKGKERIEVNWLVFTN